MHELRCQKVLFLDFGSSCCESTALEGILNDANYEVVREDLRRLSALRVRDWLVKTIAERCPSVAVLRLSSEALENDSPIWDYLRDGTLDVPIIVAAESLEASHMCSLFEMGVTDVVFPPFHAANLLPRIWRLIRHSASRSNPQSEVQHELENRDFRLLGDSPSFLAEIDKLPAVARCDVTILISGETGTGKELIARAVHYLSARRDSPFVPVDCGAVPADLAESELFGHERGAFTSAVARNPGLVAAAKEGTIFLDEVDALPLSVQAKLLRFLQQKEYRSLGSTVVKKANVRVISATNSDLRHRIQQGEFRDDLFYRLNVVQLRMPPLRERHADVAPLARHFLARYAKEFGRPAQSLSSGALQKLLTHDWPGNVRELENVMQAAVALCENPVICGSHVHIGETEKDAPVSFRQAKSEAVTAFEKNYVERLLRASGGNISEAARTAKKNRRAFWQLIRRYAIDTRQFKADGTEPAVYTNSQAGPPAIYHRNAPR